MNRRTLSESNHCIEHIEQYRKVQFADLFVSFNTPTHTHIHKPNTYLHRQCLHFLESYYTKMKIWYNKKKLPY